MPVRFHVVNAWQKKFQMDEFSLTCDAGLESGRCLWKGVVYCMSCAECGELYARETERPVRKRFADRVWRIMPAEFSAENAYFKEAA